MTADFLIPDSSAAIIGRFFIVAIGLAAIIIAVAVCVAFVETRYIYLMDVKDEWHRKFWIRRQSAGAAAISIHPPRLRKALVIELTPWWWRMKNRDRLEAEVRAYREARELEEDLSTVGC